MSSVACAQDGYSHTRVGSAASVNGIVSVVSVEQGLEAREEELDEHASHAMFVDAAVLSDRKRSEHSPVSISSTRSSTSNT